MIVSHPIWSLVIIACIAWYSTITLYVAFKGFRDIRSMLRDLKARDQAH